MSNSLAVATVTCTLSQLIQNTITNDISCARVTMVRPDNGTGLPDTGVNIFLYQVTPNAAWRNEDLPSRRAGGELVQRPRAAIDLHYLFSFYGDETRLEPQRLLGSVMRTFHSQPVLTRKKVYEAVTCGPTYLNSSNLYDDIETVKFTPLPLSLEELSKLWSCFFQTKYALSVAYIGSPVLIESDEAPQKALPVLVVPNVYASVFRFPSITAIEPQTVEFDPAATVTIRGNNLRVAGPDTTKVLFNGREGSLVPTPDQNSLTVTLPASVQAGVNKAQVIHNKQLGATTMRSAESNIVALIIQPKLNRIIFGDFGTPPGPAFKVDVSPQVGERQRIMLLLNQIADPMPQAPLAFTLSAAHRGGENDPIIFDAGNVPSGTYLVRVCVDGTDNNLTIDTTNCQIIGSQHPCKFSGPKVVRP